MKTYIVQLEDHDDVLSARDKISWSKAQRVLLVWPRKQRVLERSVDLLLLQRFSQQHGAQLGLVTRNSEVLANARDLGIPTFSSAVQARQSTAWRRIRRTSKNWHKPEMERQAPEAFRVEQGVIRAEQNEIRFFRPVLLFAAVSILAALVFFFLPHAEIELHPVQQSQSLQMQVKVSPAILAPNPSGALPAQAVQTVVEGRDQVEATGSVLVADQAATGAVEFTNLTEHAVQVPQGTLVLTSRSPVKQYSVLKAITIPAGPGETATAAVQAVQPGRSGNASAEEISAVQGALGAQVAVNNVEPVRGGSERSVPAPTQADYAHLREQLLAQLQQSALAELQGRTSAGDHLLADTMYLRTVIEETREPAAGQPGNELQLILRVEYETWMVTEQDLQEMAQMALDATRKTGYQPVAGTLAVQFLQDPKILPADGEESTPVTEVAGSSSQSSAVMDEKAEPAAASGVVGISRRIAADWSETELTEAIRGTSLSEADQILRSRIPLAEPPQIRVFPGFWPWLPYLPVQIQWIVQ